MKSKRLKKLERAGRIPGPACARARSGREGLTALLHPKLVQQVDIRLTPLVVGGPEFFPDVLLELLGAGASLDFLQLDLMIKIDVAQSARPLSSSGQGRASTSGTAGWRDWTCFPP